MLKNLDLVGMVAELLLLYVLVQYSWGHLVAVVFVAGAILIVFLSAIISAWLDGEF